MTVEITPVDGLCQPLNVGGRNEVAGAIGEPEGQGQPLAVQKRGDHVLDRGHRVRVFPGGEDGVGDAVALPFEPDPADGLVGEARRADGTGWASGLRAKAMKSRTIFGWRAPTRCRNTALVIG